MADNESASITTIVINAADNAQGSEVDIKTQAMSYLVYKIGEFSVK